MFSYYGYTMSSPLFADKHAVFAVYMYIVRLRSQTKFVYNGLCAHRAGNRTGSWIPSCDGDVLWDFSRLNNGIIYTYKYEEEKGEFPVMLRHELLSCVMIQNVCQCLS